MTTPSKVPENGFYYHYKRQETDSVGTYAYEVIGVGCHTEADCRPEDAHMVVYRPLHDSVVYRAGKLFDLRPLEMWMGTVEKDGQTLPRFRRITDPNILAQLEQIRKEMYS